MKRALQILFSAAFFAPVIVTISSAQSVAVGVDIPAADLHDYGKMFAWQMRLPLDRQKLPAAIELILSGRWYSRDESKFDLSGNPIDPDEIISPDSKYILAGAETAMQFKILNQYGQLVQTYSGLGGGLFYRYMKEEMSDLPVFRKNGHVASFLGYFGIRINMTSFYNIDVRFEYRKIFEGKVPDFKASSSAGEMILIKPDYRIYTLSANVNFITQIKQVF